MQLLSRPTSIFLLLAVAVVHALVEDDVMADKDTAKNNNNSLSDDDYTFEQYVKDFGKSYKSDIEYLHRQAIFETNKMKILQHNRQKQKQSSSSYVMGLNHFTDRLDHELPLGYDKSHHAAWQSATTDAETTTETNRELVARNKVKLNIPSVNLEDLPTSVDWRAKGGITTPVKNQGGCGSCWAFASTAALESHIAIQTGTLFSLSVQEFVSCAPNPKHCGGEGGCTGSTAELAYDFVAKHGIVEEWSFGYQSYHGQNVNCTILDDNDKNDNEDAIQLLRGTSNESKDISSPSMVKGAVASIVGFSNLPSNHYATLLTAVATIGPVVVAVAASGWGLYHSGVFNDDQATKRDLNHAVVLEGYGTDQKTGEDFWLIRNSWGPTWGEDGYIRLKRLDPITLDDPSKDCKIDDTPDDGVACSKDDDGNDVKPKAVPVCGTSGILFDGVVPIGGHLL